MDYDNRPVVRLTEQRDLYKGELPEDRVTPLEKYKHMKDANKEYFNEVRSATSLEDRVRISIKHSDTKKDPTEFIRGPFKAFNQFKKE